MFSFFFFLHLAKLLFRKFLPIYILNYWRKFLFLCSLVSLVVLLILIPTTYLVVLFNLYFFEF